MPVINPKARACSDAIRSSLSRFVDTVGELKASSDLGVNRLTLARAIAGFPLRESTRCQLEDRLVRANAT